MSTTEIGLALLALGALMIGAHALAYAFERMRQPRLIGEILAGILLGPFVLGQLAPGVAQRLFNGGGGTVNKTEIVLNFVYWLGLLLLMFLSGSETRRLLARENRREIGWIIGVGTPLPFLLVLILGLNDMLPLRALVGTAGELHSTLLVLAIAVAVTSIPVISRIFYDLKILHTRFAALILGSAVLEDIILWGVLAIATALASSAALARQHLVGDITAHIAVTLVYTAAALTVAPAALRRVHEARWNFLLRVSPTAYVIAILLVYAAVAAAFDITLVFAAFLAGFGLVGGMDGSERHRFREPLESIASVAMALFIPVYFAVVGYKLHFGRGFSLTILVTFLLGSTALCLLSVGLAARLAGFRGLDIFNLALTTNARGGPGIVLATVAYEAGIINAAFYTTLVLTAVFTSQAAGIWLRLILSRGWPLLSTNPTETWARETGLGTARSR
jgi:Kef-type K+ transport system membrane component KefB